MKISSFFRGESALIRGNFLILMFSWGIMYFAHPIPATYSSLYYLSLGASEFLLSVIGFAGSIAIAIVQLPGGYLADKHGRRWLIATMTFGMASGTLFFIFAPSWEFIILGLMVQNLCAIYAPALMALLIDSLHPQSRATGYSLQSVVTSLVLLPAPLIAQYLIFRFNFDFGMRIGYTIVLIAYLAAAMLRLKLKETLPANNQNSGPKIIDAIREYPKSAIESLRVWKKISKSAFYLFLSSISINGLVVSCQTYFVVYATSILSVSEAQWALVLTFMYVSTAIPGILAGISMDALGKKIFLILGYLLYLPGMTLFVGADFNMLLLSFFFYGLGNMLQLNSYQTIMGDMIPRNLRGTAIGCIQFFMYLSQAFQQILIGVLYVYVSPQLPFLLLAIASIPFSIIILLKVQEPTTKEI